MSAVAIGRAWTPEASQERKSALEKNGRQDAATPAAHIFSSLHARQLNAACKFERRGGLWQMEPLQPARRCMATAAPSRARPSTASSSMHAARRPASACPSVRSRTDSGSGHLTAAALASPEPVSGLTAFAARPVSAAARRNPPSLRDALSTPTREGSGRRVFRLNGRQIYHPEDPRTRVEHRLLCRELQAEEDRAASRSAGSAKAAAANADEAAHWREVAREEAARRFEALSELNTCRRALEAANKELAGFHRKDELKQDRRRARPSTAAARQPGRVATVRGAATAWPNFDLAGQRDGDSFADFQSDAMGLTPPPASPPLGRAR